MKPPVLHSALFALLALMLSPFASHASTAPPADSVQFCAPFDYEQLRREHPRPAAKPLGALNAGEPRTVRLIYFFPNDRTPQQDIDAKLDEVMKNVQLSYEEVMEYHGFGRRTFTLETDATGKAVVHHVKGKFNDEYYHKDTFRKVVWQETAEQFDPSANIYLVALVSRPINYCTNQGFRLIFSPSHFRRRKYGTSRSASKAFGCELANTFRA